MTPLRPGDPRVLGPYQLLGVLGAGGAGRVFLGSSAEDRHLAITLMPAAYSSDRTLRRRFRRDVRAARRIDARYAAPVVAADVRAEQPWFATAYVEGPSLDHVVRSRGALSLDGAFTLGLGLAEALVSIHRAGLVHGDLRPSNVLVTENGPRVIDLVLAPDHAANRPAPGAGATPYLSPEHLGESGPAPASDVFCLGAILAFAATGVGPLGTGSPQTMLSRLIKADWQLDRLTPRLRQLIDPCLDQRAIARPTARTLRRTLRRLGASQPRPGWYESGGGLQAYGDSSRGAATW